MSKLNNKKKDQNTANKMKAPTTPKTAMSSKMKTPKTLKHMTISELHDELSKPTITDRKDIQRISRQICKPYVHAGFNTMPVNTFTGSITIGPPTGVTDTYHKYLHRKPRIDEIDQWLNSGIENTFQGLAIIFGATSGNLCAVNIKANEAHGEDVMRWYDLLDHLPEALRKKLVLETDMFGLKVFYRSVVERPCIGLADYGRRPLIDLLGAGACEPCYPSETCEKFRGSIYHVADLTVAEENCLLEVLQKMVFESINCRWVGPMNFEPQEGEEAA